MDFHAGIFPGTVKGCVSYVTEADRYTSKQHNLIVEGPFWKLVLEYVTDRIVWVGLCRAAIVNEHFTAFVGGYKCITQLDPFNAIKSHLNRHLRSSKKMPNTLN